MPCYHCRSRSRITNIHLTSVSVFVVCTLSLYIRTFAKVSSKKCYASFDITTDFRNLLFLSCIVLRGVFKVSGPLGQTKKLQNNQPNPEQEKVSGKFRGTIFKRIQKNNHHLEMYRVSSHFVKRRSCPK